ncbi:MAG: sulfatase [Prevotella sp.]|jgi:arylsulfatase A-like enzyme
MKFNHLFFSVVPAVFTALPCLSQQKPNVLIIYTDDMGIGDLSCYNGGWVSTPHIDELAKAGIKFNGYYTASPVSSPSRSGLTTGRFPSEVSITNFLNDRKSNALCEQSDYLNPAYPTMARMFRDNGYATGHFGKWHMGGGRDVDDAPQIPKYGFDEYVSTWESPDPDKLITASNWIWSAKDSIKRWDRTAYFVDKVLDFLKRHSSQPCFVNLWPDDMHTPWVPSAYYFGKGNLWEEELQFRQVLWEYDRQIGRLIDGLKRQGQWENTIIIFSSDNGALPTFNQIRSNGLRGSKISLYEGGINMPFLICWPKVIKPHQTDNESVICSVDLLPSLCKIIGGKKPKGTFSGEDVSECLLGKAVHHRQKPLYWDFGRNNHFGHPKKAHQRSPHLAIRMGDYKVLCDSDGTNLQMYNIKADKYETDDISMLHKHQAKSMAKEVITWFKSKKHGREQ